MNFKNGFMMHPRLERQVTRLFVKREPRYVNAALSHWEIKPRIPRASTVTMDGHVVRLRRYFVWICHLCAVIDINWHIVPSNCHVNYEVQFWNIFTAAKTVTLPKITNRYKNKSRNYDSQILNALRNLILSKLVILNSRLLQMKNSGLTIWMSWVIPKFDFIRSTPVRVTNLDVRY